MTQATASTIQVQIDRTVSEIDAVLELAEDKFKRIESLNEDVHTVKYWLSMGHIDNSKVASLRSLKKDLEIEIEWTYWEYLKYTRLAKLALDHRIVLIYQKKALANS